ncbi:ATP-binding cassette sub- G member 1 [Geranomyces variabilis]|nr:ATP-binding cassette sub- G member 1 [Geranomyces variabilis]
MSTSNFASSTQVAFENIRFTIDVPDASAKKPHMFASQPMKQKVILNSVSGVFRAGRLTAVMGASGAGKTSLLNVLAGQTDGGHTTGNIYTNKAKVTGDQMRKGSGFVFQDDVILPTMTTREAIAMSATLRLGDAVSQADKDRRVDEMLDLLNLRKCANTVIGSPTLKGVSGGERKRVAIAMELLIEPTILFLDEPTSGLDSFTAYSVINILKNLAATGRTIIATIHQPSSEVFALFDDVLFLAEGMVMFQGPTNTVIEYFNARGYPCPNHWNPPDFIFMAVLNNQEGTFEQKGSETNLERIDRLCAYWKDSPECKELTRYRTHPSTSASSSDELSKTKRAKTKFLTQYRFLVGREGRNSLRNPLVLRAKFGQTIIMSLIIGLLFLNTKDKKGYAATQNRQGVLFFLVINQVMSSTMSILSIFAQDKLVFAREHGSGYYSLAAFFFAKIGVELPSQIFFPFATATIIYWMVGLQANGGKYLITCAICILSSMTGFSLGISLASVFPSLPVALAVTPVLLLPLMLFAGLFVNSDAIPAYFDWIKYISPMKWGFEGMVKNEYNGLTIDNGDGTFTPGPAVIKQLGFDDGLNVWFTALMQIVFVLGLISIAYLALYSIVNKHERRTKSSDTGAPPAPVRMESIVVA